MDIHTKNERTGKYTPLVSKSYNELEEELKHLVAESVQPVNPNDTKYKDYSIAIFDENNGKLLENKCKTVGKELLFTKNDVKKFGLHQFSKIVPMNKITKYKFRKGFIYSKKGNLIGGLNFSNGH